MDSQAAREAMQYVRSGPADSSEPIETLANLIGALRRGRTRVHLDSAVQAAGLAAELAREAAVLRGDAVDTEELEQQIQDAAAREAAKAGADPGRPAYGPAAFERAAEKAEDLLRGYGRLLRSEAGGGDITGALNALEAEGIGLAGEPAYAVDQERKPFG